MTPEILYWAPKFLYERYQKPIYVTENGMSSHDWVALDGKVHDASRVDFMHRYLREFKKQQQTVWISAVILPGLSWTILSGRTVTPSALVWSM